MRGCGRCGMGGGRGVGEGMGVGDMVVEEAFEVAERP